MVRYMVALSLISNYNINTKDMKIGTRIRIFEINKGGVYGCINNKLNGKQRAENINSYWFGNDTGTQLITNDLTLSNINLHFNIQRDVKQVATMVITKIK